MVYGMIHGMVDGVVYDMVNAFVMAMDMYPRILFIPLHPYLDIPLPRYLLTAFSTSLL